MIGPRVLVALALAGLLTACSKDTTAPPVIHGAAVVDALAAESLPAMTVHKSPSCGCCGLWVEHMKQAGFPVSIVAMDDLNPLKIAMGVPADGASCHTAIVGGYFIEGHVPAADIRRVLAERPAARGLTVPGMVAGSPGMEVPSGEAQPYTVYLVDLNGNRTPFSHHGQ